MPVIAPPWTYGRDEELAVLHAALDAADRGQGQVLFVSGVPGSGKSHLAGVAGAAAAAQGMRVLCGHASSLHQPTRLGPIAEALAGAFRGREPVDPDLLEPFAPALRGVLLECTATEGELDLPDPLVFEAIVRLLSTLGRDTGALCVLEDLQWSDPTTIAALEYFSRNLAGERVVCLATVRPEPPSPASALAARLCEAGTTSGITLPALHDDDLDHLVAELLGDESPPQPLLETVHGVAEGVPGVAVALVSEARRSGALRRDDEGLVLTDDGTLPVPPAMREEIRDQIALLDVPCQRVLEVAALLDRVSDPGIVAAAAGLDEMKVRSCLRQLVEQGLLRADEAPAMSLSFPHALDRDAVVANLLPTDRVALGGRVLEALERFQPEIPRPWRQRAADLALMLGDQPRACAYLAGAARDLLASGAPRAAGELVERARRLATSDLVLDVDVLYTSALLDAARGDAQAIDELASVLPARLEEECASATRLVEAHLALAQAAEAGLDAEVAEHHLDQTAKLLDQAQDPSLRSRHAVLLAQLRLSLGDVDEAQQLLEPVLSAVDEEPATLAHALHIAASCRLAESVDDAGALLRRELVIGERHQLGLVKARATIGQGILQAAGTSDLDRLVVARDTAASMGSVELTAVADVSLGALQLIAGELDNAAGALEAAVAAGRDHALGQLPLALGWMGLAHLLAARTNQVDSLLAEADALGGGRADVSAVVWGTRAMASLLTEQRDDAVRALDLATQRPSSPQWVALPSRSLQVLLAAIEDIVVVPAEPRAVPTWTRLDRGLTAFAAAVVHGRAGQAQAAQEALEEGRSYLAVAPWHRYVGERLVAEAANRDGWGDPASMLREVLSFFDERGHRDVAAACRRLLADMGVPVPRRRGDTSKVPAHLRALGLTSREMEVLELVRDGLTNAEIAARLFVSQHTVKTHLTHLLQKTGASSRTELGELHPAEDPEPLAN